MIESFIEKDSLALSVFVKLKSSCSHGKFRTLQEASNRSGISKSVLYRHYKSLISENVLKKTPQGFVLATRKEIEQKYNSYHCSTIIHHTGESLVDIRHSLLIKLTERAARQQHVNFRVLLNDTLSDLSVKARCRKIKKLIEIERSTPRRLDKVKYAQLLTNVGFTHEYLGDLMGVSKSTSWNIIRKAKKKKKCRTKVLSVFICHMTMKEFMTHRDELRTDYPSVIWKDGKVYYNVCTLYGQYSYWDKEPKSVIGFSTKFKDLTSGKYKFAAQEHLNLKYSSKIGKE
jgi:hypothetical protein